MNFWRAQMFTYQICYVLYAICENIKILIWSFESKSRGAEPVNFDCIMLRMLNEYQLYLSMNWNAFSNFQFGKKGRWRWRWRRWVHRFGRLVNGNRKETHEENCEKWTQYHIHCSKFNNDIKPYLRSVPRNKNSLVWFSKMNHFFINRSLSHHSPLVSCLSF